MDRREMLKVLTLGLVSGPAALEMFERLNHQRRLFPSAAVTEWRVRRIVCMGNPHGGVQWARDKFLSLPDPGGPVYTESLVRVNKDGELHPNDRKHLEGIHAGKKGAFAFLPEFPPAATRLSNREFRTLYEGDWADSL